MYQFVKGRIPFGAILMRPLCQYILPRLTDKGRGEGFSQLLYQFGVFFGRPLCVGDVPKKFQDVGLFQFFSKLRRNFFDGKKVFTW